MDDSSSFYRVTLSGEQVAVSYAELAALRKDILRYFDDNLGETTSLYMPADEFTLPYWEYLSLNFAQQWAESVHYQRLVEEGCLALLNGIALELLDEPVTQHWREQSVEQLLQYVVHYQPSSARLGPARDHLVRTLTFIRDVSERDFDQYGSLATNDYVPGALWIADEIVRAYYSWRLTIHGV
jgi:hypothetical protein